MPPGAASHFLSATTIGAAVGFVSGLLGKGGSAVTTPALRIFLDVPRFAALASPLPASIPTTLAASVAYRGRGLVDRTVLLTTVAVGLPATVLGSLASPLAGGHILMLLTALLVIALGAVILLHGERDAAPPPAADGLHHRWRLVAVGLLVGFLSGLLANTGGVLYAPLFIKWAKVETKRALATSLVVSAVLAVPGTLTHAALGHVDWRLVLALSVGSIPTSYWGARLALSLRNDVLLRVYGLSLTAFGLYDLLYTEREALVRLFGR